MMNDLNHHEAPKNKYHVSRRADSKPAFDDILDSGPSTLIKALTCHGWSLRGHSFHMCSEGCVHCIIFFPGRYVAMARRDETFQWVKITQEEIKVPHRHETYKSPSKEARMEEYLPVPGRWWSGRPMAQVSGLHCTWDWLLL